MLKYALAIFYLILLTALIISSIYQWRGLGNFLTGLIVTAIIIIITLVLFTNTFYILNDDVLIVKYGFIKKVIPINEIIRIRLNKKSTAAIMLRASFSFHGIIVYYNGTRIFISPENEKDFLQKLKSINPDINIF